MNPTKVLFLNGTSSSGKTTLAKAFQDLMEEPVLYVSNDKFIFMVSDRDLKNDAVRPKVLIPLLAAFHRCLPIIGACGFPMLIDSVIERRDWMDQVAGALEGFTAYSVKVHCPLEELERREKQRGDRQVGLARWQADIVHTFIGYDLEIDTGKESTDESAKNLRALYESNVEPTAFATYRKNRGLEGQRS